MSKSDRDKNGFRMYSEGLVQEAMKHWGEIAKALSPRADATASDRVLLLDLVRCVGPRARDVLESVIDGIGSGGDIQHTTAALKAICSDHDLLFERMRRLCTHEDPSVRAKVPLVMSEMGGSFEALGRSLTPFLGDSNGEVRSSAAGVLWLELQGVDRVMESLEPGAGQIAFHLDNGVCGIGVLATHGMLMGSTVDDLVRSLRSNEASLTDERLEYLVREIPRYRFGVDSRLVAMQKDSNPRIRRWGVALDFSAIGVTRVGIVPRLRSMLKDPDALVRGEAERALAALEGRN